MRARDARVQAGDVVEGVIVAGRAADYQRSWEVELSYKCGEAMQAVTQKFRI